MTSPDRTRAVAELDALTEGLPERAEALASRLDRVMHMRHGTVVNGRRWIEGVDHCPRCLLHDCPGCGPVRQDPVLVTVAGGLVELIGPDGEPLCVWCRETAGTCTLTGGPVRCEGTHEFYANQLQAAAAPRLPRPIHIGGSHVG